MALLGEVVFEPYSVTFCRDEPDLGGARAFRTDSAASDSPPPAVSAHACVP